MKIHILIHIWLATSLISYIGFIFQSVWEDKNEFTNYENAKWKWWEYLVHVPIHYTIIGAVIYWWNREPFHQLRVKLKNRRRSWGRKKTLKKVQ